MLFVLLPYLVVVSKVLPTVELHSDAFWVDQQMLFGWINRRRSLTEVHYQYFGNLVP